MAQKKTSTKTSKKKTPATKPGKASALPASFVEQARLYARKTLVISRRHKKASLFSLVALGFIAGLLLGYGLWHDGDSVSKDSSQSSSARQDRDNRRQDRLDGEYQRSQESIKKDEASGRIDKAKADVVRTKLDEVYNYLKSTGVSNLDSDDLREKRKEWSAWAREQGVSSAYLLRLAK